MHKGDTLVKLFGSEAKVRLLRLFLVNPTEVFDPKTISARIHMKPAAFSKDMRALLDMGYVRRGTRVITGADDRARGARRKKLPGFVLARDFAYLQELSALLVSQTPAVREQLAAGIRGAGKVSLIVITGTLLNAERRMVDLFIVGDKLKKPKIEKSLKTLEATIGKEIMYAMMTTTEFRYRYGMYDRFLKDLFDNPHEIVLDKLDRNQESSIPLNILPS